MYLCTKIVSRSVCVRNARSVLLECCVKFCKSNIIFERQFRIKIKTAVNKIV